ncbi:MAG: ion channel [Brevinematales bacterium]|nr:ion channel [Brevinematales bacterium]
MNKKKKVFFIFKLKNFFSEPGNRIIILFFGIIIIASFIIFLVEKREASSTFKNLSDWIWWLVVTIPTVGYGDIVPKTTYGRLIGIFVIIFGVATYTIFSGIIASILIDVRLKERRGLSKVHFKDHILIIGRNSNLQRILEAIPNFLKTTALNIVLVNEMNEEEFLDLKTKFYYFNLKFVHGDYTKETTLKRANIEAAKYAIILADNTVETKDIDEKTILTILSIRSLNQNVSVVAEVVRDEKIKPVLKAGANEIIFNGEFNPVLFSSFLSYPAIPAFLRELVGNITNPRIEIEEIPERFVNKNFKELFYYIRENKKCLPIAILRVEKELSINDILSGEGAIDLFIKSKLKEAMTDDGEEKKFDIKINPPDDYTITELDNYIFIVK